MRLFCTCKGTAIITIHGHCSYCGLIPLDDLDQP